ncbi:MAG: TrkH family potassium uptake protein [Bacillota bacterium]|nr:TrkH family potassium uptake protein [Bacillota bacterium]
MKWNRKPELNPVQILVIGYLIMITIGTFLLSLPISQKAGQAISTIDALFTATSATAITGLVVVNTGETFSTFGQVVIMILFQIGAIGFMTLTTVYALILGKNISFKDRLVLQSSLNQLSYAGIVRLTLIVIAVTFLMEAVAALILFLHWLPEMGAGQALYYGIFHAISGFANAGFDLFPNSLHQFTGDIVVNATIITLFVMGGLGFTVLVDLYIKKGKFKRLSLHSKLMLYLSAILGLTGIISVFILEYHNPATMAGFTMKERILASIFQGLTPRSAGFSTIDIGQMHPVSIMITKVLMFIGGGPGSNAGGIKLTTFGILLIVVYTMMRGREDFNVFSRRLPQHLVNKSLAISIIGIGAVFLISTILLFTEGAPFDVVVFEVISAFATVGLSAGLTPDLSPTGKIIITITMFIGRLGPLSLAFALSTRKRKSGIKYIEEDVVIG